ncbi:MAG TPA: type II secretion system protein [Hyphomicrobiales bacterium]|nr:type II secretion system protein [Hyphomicrobiales bacterium]
MKRRNNQQGFTIIELVVVILLLGILTATALPRFMDVTNEAHQAVADGLQGGMQTGVALYRAQWVATGQKTDGISEFGGLRPNTAGYPVTKVAATNVLTDEVDCVAIYENLMQAGGLPVIAGAAYNASAETAIEGASTGVDVVTMPDAAATPTACTYYYVGQYKTGTSTAVHTIPNFTYTVATGVIESGTTDLETD